MYTCAFYSIRGREQREFNVKSHAARKINILGKHEICLFCTPNLQVQRVVHLTWRQPEIDSLATIRLMEQKEGTTSFSDKAAAAMGAVGVKQAPKTSISYRLEDCFIPVLMPRNLPASPGFRLTQLTQLSQGAPTFRARASLSA